MNGVLEIIKTENCIYIGFISDEDSICFSDDGKEINCIVMNPIGDHDVEIWIPKKIIVNRSKYEYVA